MARKVDLEQLRELKDKLTDNGVGYDITPIQGKIKRVLGTWWLNRPGNEWLWIAIEQPSKATFFGVVLSPFTPEGEWGSWYIDDPQRVNAKTLIEPRYRWKPDKETQVALDQARALFGR